MHVADTESREPSNWTEIHDRLRPEDIARDQYLNECCAAEDAERAERSKAWRANVERARRQRLRRAAQLLHRPAATPTAE